MTIQYMRRAIIAPDLEIRLHDFLEKLWNDKDIMFRHDFRMLFHGIKPNSVDFLINTAMVLCAVYSKKDPEA